MKKLFNYYKILINLYDNKISIIDKYFKILDLECDLENIVDIKLKLEKMIKYVTGKIPFSLIKSKIIILVPGDIHENELHEYENIIYKNGYKKLREMRFISDGLIIIGLFEEWNKCIYLIDIKEKILGFAACAGQPITEMFYFNNNSIDYMINHIKNEIQNNSFNKLKEMLKNVNLDIEKLWNNEKIILSINLENYNSIGKNNIQNKYIPDILNIGLFKYVKKINKKGQTALNKR